MTYYEATLTQVQAESLIRIVKAEAARQRVLELAARDKGKFTDARRFGNEADAIDLIVAKIAPRAPRKVA